MSYQEQPASNLERAQTVVTHLLREPVKEAVKEALQEEAASVSQAQETDRGEPVRSRDESTTEDSSGGSKLPVGLGLVVVAGAAYLLRRRRQSDSTDYTQESLEHDDRGVDRPESEPSVEAGQDTPTGR